MTLLGSEGWWFIPAWRLTFFPAGHDEITLTYRVEVFISIFHGILISLALSWPILPLLFVEFLPGLLYISKSNQCKKKWDFLNFGQCD